MLTSEIIVAVLAFVGTLVGSMSTMIMSNKLTLYRIDQLEEKVNKHNNIIERTYKIEERNKVADEKLKVINHRIDALEEDIK